MKHPAQLEPNEAVRVAALGTAETELAGRVVMHTSSRACIMLGEELTVGAPVSVRAAHSLLLGEVCYSSRVEQEYMIYVDIEHVLGEPGRTPYPEAAPANVRDLLVNLDREPLVPAVLALLRAIRVCAVKASPAEYRRFEAAMQGLEEQLTSSGEVREVTDSATRLLQGYNHQATEFFLRKIAELEELVAVLTETLSGPPPGVEQSMKVLQKAQDQLENQEWRRPV